MANPAVTLTSGVVSTVTIEGDHDAVEVVQLAGTPVAVYFTVGTTADKTPNPVAGTIGAGAGGSFVLPAVLGASRVIARPTREPRTIVKIVAVGTPTIGVQPLGSQVTIL